MKDQYFGDINDYLKYGILRAIARTSQLRCLLCWMLTESDGSSDGRKITYLNQKQQERFKRHDPFLYEHLQKAVLRDKRREVWREPQLTLLPRTEFFSDLVPDDRTARQVYFSNLLDRCKDCDLVFFDPDNGMEIKSKPKGNRKSNKYLYWDELRTSYEAGQSVIVFQHFRREKHEVTIQTTLQKAALCLRSSKYSVLRGSSVFHLLVPQPRHLRPLAQAIERLERDWRGLLKVSWHDRLTEA